VSSAAHQSDTVIFDVEDIVGHFSPNMTGIRKQHADWSAHILQSVLNALARLIYGLLRFYHVFDVAASIAHLRTYPIQIGDRGLPSSTQ